jgi:hypothetical protein
LPKAKSNEKSKGKDVCVDKAKKDRKVPGYFYDSKNILLKMPLPFAPDKGATK